MASNNGNGNGESDPPPGGNLEVKEEYQPCFIRYITAIARVGAVLVVIGLWIVVVQTFSDKHKFVWTHWYLLLLAIVVTIFEMIWVIHKCTKNCNALPISLCHQTMERLISQKDGGCGCMIWKALVWVDNWKKAIFHVGLSLPCFVANDIKALQSYIAGCLVILSAALYFTKSFAHSKCVKRKRYNATPVDQTTSSQEAGLVHNEAPTPGTTTYGTTEASPPGTTTYGTTEASPPEAAEETAK